MTPVSAAKTDLTAAFGKLVTAFVVCGGSAAGINMNKYQHIMEKLQRGLDGLNPEEMVCNVVELALGAAGLGSFYVTLKTGTIIIQVFQLSDGGLGMGTAYVVTEIADAVRKAC